MTRMMDRRNTDFHPQHSMHLLLASLRILLVLLAFVTLSIPAYAVSVSGDEGSKSRFSLEHDIAIQQDPTGALTLRDVSEGSRKDAFRPLGKATVEPTVAHDIVWLRFSLGRTVNAPGEWILEVRPPSLDHVELFAPDGLGGFSSAELGDRLPFVRRMDRRQDKAFRIALDTREQFFFMRVESTAFNSLLLRLWQPAAFDEHKSRQDLLLGVTLGATAAMFFLNIIFWRWLRDPLYFHYAGLLVATAYVVLFATGYAERMQFWDPLFADRGLGIAFCAYNMVSISFICRIFELKRQMVWAWSVFRVVIIVNFVALLAAVIGRYGVVAWWVDWTVLFAATFGVGAILYLVLVRKQHQYLMAVAAFSPSAVACIVRTLEALGFWDLGAGAGMDISWRIIATVSHLVLLNVAIANRTRTAEANYRHARRRALSLARRGEREMEAKVRVRTKRLAEANTTLRDEVSRRGALEARLVNSLEVERSALEQQRQFVSMVSHEFRTPLAVIEATAEALERWPSGKDDFVERRIEKIKRSVKRLSLLIENVLAKDKLDMGSLSPRVRETFELYEMALNVQAAVGESESQRLTVQPGAEAVLVFGDRALLEIVLQNLVQNALRYSPPDSEVVVVIEARENVALVEVRDHGSGIPEQEQRYLFQKYFRASDQRRRPGSGLGLHISREIARQHGGEVALVSSGERGSVFRLSLPLAPPSA
jgi:signal transduction histidine kinase